jgi:molybdopterin/thiamine biosynthesis adenylyltransferase
MEREIFEKYLSSQDGIHIIGHKELRQLATENALTTREMEIMALRVQVVPSRYLANVKFIGVSGQLKLLESQVAVIGCGAVGGSVCEMLARLGVGQVHLVDFDVFDETNLNRQIMCTEEDIGRSKVECTKKRMNLVNSGITSIPHNTRLTKDNALSLIRSCDLVFDGLDNAADKITLENACLSQRIPLIHGAISDSTFQVATITDSGILENVYAGGLENPPGGTPPCTAITCASAQVGEALKVLLGIGDIMDKALIRYDWLSCHSDVIPIDIVM